MTPAELLIEHAQIRSAWDRVRIAVNPDTLRRQVIFALGWSSRDKEVETLRARIAELEAKETA